MRRWTVESFGEPEDVWRLEDSAMPVGYSSEQVMVAHQDLLHHWRQGELEVTNCQVFDFDDARSAIAHIAAGKVEGKVVVRLTGRSE